MTCPAPRLARYPRAFLAALRRFLRRGGSIYASHVALSMMLALFPFTIFSLSLTGMVLAREADIDGLIEMIFGTWPDAIAAPITAELRNVLRDSGGATLTLGLVLALFFASNGVDAVRVALTRAYRDDDPRPFWHTRALNVGFVIGAAAVLVCVSALTVALPLALQWAPTEARALIGDIFALDAVRRGLTAAMLLGLVLAFHLWLPGQRHPLRQILPGALLTVLLWGVSGRVFAAYIADTGSYSVTYAGLAGVVAALVFLYLMAAILILGAEFNGRLMSADTRD